MGRKGQISSWPSSSGRVTVIGITVILLFVVEQCQPFSCRWGQMDQGKIFYGETLDFYDFDENFPLKKVGEGQFCFSLMYADEQAKIVYLAEGITKKKTICKRNGSYFKERMRDGGIYKYQMHVCCCQEANCNQISKLNETPCNPVYKAKELIEFGCWASRVLLKHAYEPQPWCVNYFGYVTEKGIGKGHAYPVQRGEVLCDEKNKTTDLVKDPCFQQTLHQITKWFCCCKRPFCNNIKLNPEMDPKRVAEREPVSVSLDVPAGEAEAPTTATTDTRTTRRRGREKQGCHNWLRIIMPLWLCVLLIICSCVSLLGSLLFVQVTWHLFEMEKKECTKEMDKLRHKLAKAKRKNMGLSCKPLPPAPIFKDWIEVIEDEQEVALTTTKDKAMATTSTEHTEANQQL